MKAGSLKHIIMFSPMVQSTKYEPRIPWSIIYPVIYLANEKNFKIHIIDQSIERDSWEKRVKSILKENVLCVGVSSLTGSTIHYGLQFSKMIKSINKEIPVVWGGVHASMLPQQTLANPYIDIVVRFEGEETFRDLVHILERKMPLESVKGISFKKEGEIYHNPKRPFIDLNNLPAFKFYFITLFLNRAGKVYSPNP
jgi:radical SAM superfamily enzyme YgiQ (UPF0313 family)